MGFIKVIKFLDKYIGFLLCLILFLNKIFIHKSPKRYSKILLIQLWGIGETILTLPTIKILKDFNKKNKIDILVTKRVKDVFYNNKNLDYVKVLRLNPISILIFTFRNYRKYDLVIDMEEYLNISAIVAFYVGKDKVGYSHGIRSNLYTNKIDYNDKQHAAQTFTDLLKLLGIKTRVAKLEKLNYSYEDKDRVDRLLKENNIRKKDFLVGLGIGAAESVKERMWPKERFAKLADYLIENHKAKIVFVGNKEEKKIVDETIKLIKNKNNSFNFAGQTNLREMFYLISLSKLFIGNDAGPMHVAAAQQVTTIGLFGCNLPLRFKPFGKNNYAIRKQKGEACINVHKREVGECKFGIKNACVKKIQVSDVMDIVDKIIKKSMIIQNVHILHK